MSDVCGGRWNKTPCARCGPANGSGQGERRPSGLTRTPNSGTGDRPWLKTWFLRPLSDNVAVSWPGEGSMETAHRENINRMTRREAVARLGGAVAATAAMTMLPGAAPAFAQARNLGSKTKTLMWVASVTPCDKNLKFDPGAFRDILAWFQHNGADGIVVLGTTGEFPSFSVAERKLISETALKNKMGMNFLVNPGTSNFPETLELARHAADHGADGLLVIPP